MPKRKKTEDCPHCRRKDTLTETTDEKEDTEQVKVRVWHCAECDYTEGRPVEEVKNG